MGIFSHSTVERVGIIPGVDNPKTKLLSIPRRQLSFQLIQAYLRNGPIVEPKSFMFWNPVRDKLFQYRRSNELIELCAQMRGIPKSNGDWNIVVKAGGRLPQLNDPSGFVDALFTN